MPEDVETEVKFFIQDLESLRNRLEACGAELEQPRQHELNLRFDTAEGALAIEKRVLRLRKDAGAWLTYKGPSQPGAEVTVRQEIEFGVDNFEAARRFLEALGYRISVMYEKYRATYLLEGLKVTLDELPYGRFIEIEGPDAASIQSVAQKLGVDWSARVVESYLAMFDRVRERLALPVLHLTFEAFEGVPVEPGDLGVRPGDSAG
jgi:adenylate cyclase class 2